MYPAKFRAGVCQLIGRRLSRYELIVHIDRDTTNNDLRNLALVTRSQHWALTHGYPLHLTSIWDLLTANGIIPELPRLPYAVCSTINSKEKAA
jgi:hypothetical protein